MMMRLSLFQQAIVAGSRVFKLLDEEELAPSQGRESTLKIEDGEIEFRTLAFPMTELGMF